MVKVNFVYWGTDLRFPQLYILERMGKLTEGLGLYVVQLAKPILTKMNWHLAPIGKISLLGEPSLV